MGVPPADFDVERYRYERNAALRSLDDLVIRAYMDKYGIRAPSDSLTFWGAVHKARAWCEDFTDEERLTSIRWLEAHGFRSIVP